MELPPEVLNKRLPHEPAHELLRVLQKAIDEPFVSPAAPPPFARELGRHIGRVAVSDGDGTPGGPQILLVMQALAVLVLHDDLAAKSSRENERAAWRAEANAVAEELQAVLSASTPLLLLADDHPPPQSGVGDTDTNQPGVKAPTYTGPATPRWIVNPIRPAPPNAETAVAHASQWAERTRFVPDDTFNAPLAVETGVSRWVSIVRVSDDSSIESREGEQWRSLQPASSFAIPEPDPTQADQEFLVDDSVRETKCGQCAGAGNLRCSGCAGRGFTPCERRETCSGCSGSGRRGNDRCATCLGNGAVVCRKCQGRGSIRCSTCRGDGVVGCHRCAGEGRVTQYKVRRWHRRLHLEGGETLGRELQTRAADWERVLSCPVVEVSENLLDDELVTVQRLLKHRPDDLYRDLFVVVHAVPWALVKTKARRPGGEPVETYVLGDTSPRVASPVIEGHARRSLAVILTCLALLGLVVVVAVLVFIGK